MKKVICVFSSASKNIDKIYFKEAKEIGARIAKQGDILLFGSGINGLMGASATSAHKNNGKVIGVIPKALKRDGYIYPCCNKLIVTKEMHTRKKIMISKSHAFIALPGGFGTLEELLEVITLKQLGYHKKPIIIMNTNNFYNKLLGQIDEIINQNFASDNCGKLYEISHNTDSAFEYINANI